MEKWLKRTYLSSPDWSAQHRCPITADQVGKLLELLVPSQLWLGSQMTVHLPAVLQTVEKWLKGTHSSSPDWCAQHRCPITADQVGKLLELLVPSQLWLGSQMTVHLPAVLQTVEKWLKGTHSSSPDWCAQHRCPITADQVGKLLELLVPSQLWLGSHMTVHLLAVLQSVEKWLKGTHSSSPDWSAQHRCPITADQARRLLELFIPSQLWLGSHVTVHLLAVLQSVEKWLNRIHSSSPDWRAQP